MTNPGASPRDHSGHGHYESPHWRVNSQSRRKYSVFRVGQKVDLKVGSKPFLERHPAAVGPEEFVQFVDHVFMVAEKFGPLDLVIHQNVRRRRMPMSAGAALLPKTSRATRSRRNSSTTSEPRAL